jgi:HAD superfamily hydrolase (TIGR01509 family)
MRVILFDLMDTILKDPFYDVVDRLLPAGVGFDEFMRARNLDLYLEFERGEIDEHDYFRNYYRESESFQAMPEPLRVKNEILKNINYMGGMRELLGALRAHPLLLGIASNYSPWYTEIFKRLPGFADQFDYHFFSCEMGVRKPDPDYFTRIDQTIRVRHPELLASDFMIIDDRPENLTAPAGRGWRTFLMGSPEELRAFLEGDFLRDTPR